MRPPADGDVLDLASNDYLGLARDKLVIDAALEATELWGAGSTGSRLVTGTTELHATLERELAAIIDAGACHKDATTVVDLTPMADGNDPVVIRQGRGELAPLGL